MRFKGCSKRAAGKIYIVLVNQVLGENSTSTSSTENIEGDKKKVPSHDDIAFNAVSTS